jgi:hypothetical protein
MRHLVSEALVKLNHRVVEIVHRLLEQLQLGLGPIVNQLCKQAFPLIVRILSLNVLEQSHLLREILDQISQVVPASVDLEGVAPLKLNIGLGPVVS